MHNVNFGDCVMYQENDCKLIVDCGAKYNQKGKDAYACICNDLDENTDILITHFDEDHYNGICEIPEGKALGKLYLPFYLYEKGGLWETGDIFHQTLLTWTYSVAIGKKKKISMLHRLFMKISKLVQSPWNISCVKACDPIFLDNKVFRVMWPKIQENKAVQYSRLFKNAVYENEGTIVADEPIRDFESWIPAADAYVETLESIYRYWCLFSKDLLNYEIYNESFLNTELVLLDQRFREMMEGAPSIKLNENGTKTINSINSSIIRNMNECSVVFDCEDKVLALGDITARIINNYLPGIKPYYKVIKVQHHGTKSYYTPKLPRADHYLISNSGTANLNWLIYEKYGEKLLPSGSTFCTNDNTARCEYYGKGGRCVNCKIMGSQQPYVLIQNI